MGEILAACSVKKSKLICICEIFGVERSSSTLSRLSASLKKLFLGTDLPLYYLQILQHHIKEPLVELVRRILASCGP